MIKITFIVLVTTSISLNAFADKVTEVLGKWTLDKTYCSGQQNQPAHTTRIMKIPWLGFEPRVRLNIYEKDGKQYIQKEVIGDSCSARQVKTDYFLKATHEIQISSEHINGRMLYSMNAKNLASSEINDAALQQCGNLLNGYLLYGLTYVRYPEYFHQEARRSYGISILDSKLYLVFDEADICAGSKTVMIFDKLN